MKAFARLSLRMFISNASCFFLKQSLVALNLSANNTVGHKNENSQKTLYATYPVLPIQYFAAVSIFLSIFSDMLTVCKGGYSNSWSLQGYATGYKKNLQVPSMGWKWLRSCTLEIISHRKQKPARYLIFQRTLSIWFGKIVVIQWHGHIHDVVKIEVNGGRMITDFKLMRKA